MTALVNHETTTVIESNESLLTLDFFLPLMPPFWWLSMVLKLQFHLIENQLHCVSFPLISCDCITSRSTQCALTRSTLLICLENVPHKICRGDSSSNKNVNKKRVGLATHSPDINLTWINQGGSAFAICHNRTTTSSKILSLKPFWRPCVILCNSWGWLCSCLTPEDTDGALNYLVTLTLSG